jgi:hypothetical protein
LEALSVTGPFMPRLEDGYLTGTVFNVRKVLIFPPTGVRSNEILVSVYCSLTGVERDSIYEGR